MSWHFISTERLFAAVNCFGHLLSRKILEPFCGVGVAVRVGVGLEKGVEVGSGVEYIAFSTSAIAAEATKSCMMKAEINLLLTPNLTH